MNAFWWALVTAGIWGIVPLLEKLGLGGNPPAAGVVVRSFGIVVGLVIFTWLSPPWAALKLMRWPSILLLAGSGLLASFVGQMAFYRALKHGAVSQVTPVAGAYPLDRKSVV